MHTRTLPFSNAEERYYGFTKRAYAKMRSVVLREYRRVRKAPGRRFRFGPKTILDIWLSRVFYNDTFQRIANAYGISKSTACRLFHRIHWLLFSVKEFRLPPVKDLKPGPYTVDGTIICVCRSSNYGTQRRQYSGKHKRHCAKIQIIASAGTIIPEAVTYTRFGATHDFGLFKGMADKIPDGVILIGDAGYQGMEALMPGSMTPYKKPRGGELTPEQKASNKRLSTWRIDIEHVNAYIKRFDILSTVYRGKIDELESIVKLICGICRYELLPFCLFARIGVFRKVNPLGCLHFGV